MEFKNIINSFNTEIISFDSNCKLCATDMIVLVDKVKCLGAAEHNDGKFYPLLNGYIRFKQPRGLKDYYYQICVTEAYICNKDKAYQYQIEDPQIIVLENNELLGRDVFCIRTDKICNGGPKYKFQFDAEINIPQYNLTCENYVINFNNCPPYAFKLCQYKSYYEEQLIELENNKSVDQKLTVDIDLIRYNFEKFYAIDPDNNTLVIPIIGYGKRIKGVVFEVSTSKGRSESSFNNAIITRFELDNETDRLFDEFGVPKNKGVKLYSLYVEEESQLFEVKKILTGSDVLSVVIKPDIIGEKTKLNRIIKAIELILNEGEDGEDLENHSLIRKFCESDKCRLMSRSEYEPKYIKSLSRTYNDKLNKEQYEAFDKILQMDDNDEDILLIQGPPGTGKTELILSVAKELANKGRNVLITSNVHVACDNIVERLVDEKEIILKRYTKVIGNDGYDEEKLKNIRDYINNQVLSRFKCNGKLIQSEQDLNALIYQIDNLTKDLRNERNELAELELQNAPILNKRESLLNSITICKASLADSNKQSEKVSSDLSKLNDRINDYSLQIKKIEKTKKALEDKLSKSENDRDNQFNKVKEFEKIVSDIQLEYDSLTEEIEHCKKIIDDCPSKIYACERLIKMYENQLSLIEPIETLQIKDRILNRLLSKKWRITFDDLGDAVNSTINNVFNKEIDYYNSVIRFFNLVGDISIGYGKVDVDVLKKIKSNFYSLPFTEDTEFASSLSNVLIAEKLKERKFLFFSMRLFRKRKFDIDNIKLSYNDIESANNYLYAAVEKLLSYAEHEWSFDINERVKSEALLKYKNDLRESLRNKEGELETLRAEFNSAEVNCNLLSAKVEDLDQKKRKFIDSKKKCERNFQQKNKKCDDIRLELAPKNLEFSDLSSKLDKLNENHQSKQAELEDITKLQHKKQLALDESENELSDFTFINKKALDEFDSTAKRCNERICNYERKLHTLKSASEKINECISAINNERLTEDNKRQILFEYVTEVNKTVGLDDKDFKESIRYSLDGFLDSFELKSIQSNANHEKRNGELISMTTNQVAKADGFVFDYAIVDEASKCSFEDLVICVPKVKHLVLIGDYMQLNPYFDDFKSLSNRKQIIFNNDENLWKSLNLSSFHMLFDNIVDNGSTFSSNGCVAIMSRQYRMNKGIFDLVNGVYNIHDGFKLIDEKRHEMNDVLCINDELSEEDATSNDEIISNEREASFVADIIEMIAKDRNQTDEQNRFESIKRIGIITGYAAQVNKIKRKLREKKIHKTSGLEFGTIDRFQGREYDLVILSLVRTKKIGFLKEVRRMNVALSRAKNHLIVIGNLTALNRIANQELEKLERRISSNRAEDLIEQDPASFKRNKEERYVYEGLIKSLYNLSIDHRCNSIESSLDEISEFLREK